MSLRALLDAGRYHAYAYAYPHKTAWGPLDPPVPLRDAWADEDRANLSLYLHVPFCEQRCGFCNLFTQVQPAADAVDGWWSTLQRQARAVAEALGEHRFATLAIGGGTPTLLDPRRFEALLQLAADLGAAGVPASVEASPDTLTDAHVAALAAFGVERLSLGVQSTADAETRAVQRRQRGALDAIARAAAALPVVNADLIYGLPGQDAASLRASIDDVLTAGATELYLYPLYVRPLTGLGRAERPAAPDPRPALYEAGRDHLLTAGWTQTTMRCFRAPTRRRATTWRCQDDGMVGLGPGARSYTRGLHYSSPYAVSQAAIRRRVAAWTAQSDAELRLIHHGVRLDADEQRRRYLLLVLLEQGLVTADYHARFHADPTADFPELAELTALGLADWRDGRLALTDAGRAASDVIGHWLQSPAVAARRAAWQPA